MFVLGPVSLINSLTSGKKNYLRKVGLFSINYFRKKSETWKQWGGEEVVGCPWCEWGGEEVRGTGTVQLRNFLQTTSVWKFTAYKKTNKKRYTYTSHNMLYINISNVPQYVCKLVVVQCG